MVNLQKINLSLENTNQDSFLSSAMKLSEKLGEEMQASTFIAIQDAINSKSKISLIKELSNEKKVIITEFVFTNER